VIARLLSGRRAPAALQRLDRVEGIALALVLSVVAAIGWLASPFVLAVAVALELAIGGLGAVALMGPARPRLGFARYATLALAGVAATLGGRLIPGGVSLLFVPLLAVLLWAVLWLELRGPFETNERTALDLALTAIVFAAAAGIDGIFGHEAWPPPVGLVVLIGTVLALRAAEARGFGGVQAVGQALLHALAIAQIALAVVLLHLPGLVGPAIVALAFYVWGGAADAVEQGSGSRAVALEFGSLALLGLIVALLMHQR
jgi:hypothetical protein